MLRIKQELDALDLTNRPQNLLSPMMDDEDDLISNEDEPHDSIPKVGLARILIDDPFSLYL